MKFSWVIASLKRSPSKNIKTKILALHGHDDPILLDAVLAFKREITEARRWTGDRTFLVELCIHLLIPRLMILRWVPFTIRKRDKRSWIEAIQFFEKIFE